MRANEWTRDCAVARLGQEENTGVIDSFDLTVLNLLRGSDMTLDAAVEEADRILEE
ncbi:MAG: hypothetical protein Greene041662_113 [Candidatus Peregrinibacteria bacterium Greene0416_62]|nr:MAG: hypothetical protein Greene041662_113 [Candidatus Peregrinibacteria bacterium Greene0416_62]TSC99264.1 MAG: hypothetical protein Greene101449_676 [Candidatus Peregrinibacteria bacterium Greene1014_49]